VWSSLTSTGHANAKLMWVKRKMKVCYNAESTGALGGHSPQREANGDWAN